MSFYNMYIAASAGSGKTYQLVNRFITLLCVQQLRDGTVDVSRLMAITFTRKAAAEFKSRILSELAKAASSPATAEQFWQERVDESMKQLGFTLDMPAAPHTFFSHMLRSTMAQFGKLQLSTIDSLFGNMVRGLAPELGINEISPLDPVEEQLYRRKALESTYRSYHKEEDIEQLAATFESSQSNDAALSTPDRQLFKLIQDFHELYLCSPLALWGGDPDTMSDGELALFGLQREDVTLSMSEETFHHTQEQLGRLLKEKADIFPDLVKSEENKGCYHLEHYPREMKLPPATARAYRNQFFRFAQSLSQTNSDLELPARVKENALSDINYLQRHYYPEYWEISLKEGIDLQALLEARQSIQWRSLLKRTQSVKQVLECFENTYGQEVRQTGRLSFSDITHMLRDQLDEQGLNLLQERLDMQLEHWMLDEFQDTSYEQYHILRSMLESRAQGGDDGSVFMVGDAKQSIYQFRGGDPAIFLRTRSELFGLDQAGQDISRAMPLNHSYRSAQEVLDLPNLLFEADKLQDIAIRSLPSTLEEWKAFDYQEHRSARPDLKGCAEIWQLQSYKDIDELADANQNEVLYHSIAAQLAQVRPVGCTNPPSCAILVSKRKEGKDIQEALLKLQEQYGYEGPVVLSADKLVGTDSVLGLALMHFFSWLNTPGDARSLSLLKLTPLWAIVQSMGGQQAWASLRERWVQQGCASLLRELLAKAGEDLICNDFLRQRKKIWLEEAERFDSIGGNLSEWLTHMRELSQNEEAQGNEIRIMTIHKSKGLEFDLVILPIFSRVNPLVSYNKFKLLSRKNHEGENLALLLPPLLSLYAQNKCFCQAMVEPSITQEELAGYCKLYVALTRAKKATSVLLPPFDAAKNEKESFTSLFYQLSESHPGPDEDEELLHANEEDVLATCSLRLGLPDWYLLGEGAQQKSQQETIPAEELAAAPRNYSFTSLPRRTPSTLDQDRVREEDAVEADAPPRPLGDNRGAAFGSLIHKLMEDVAWSHCPLPNWAAVSDQTAVTTIQRALSSTAWAPYFCKPAHELRLYREQNIEAIVDGHWVSGQIDRLVVHYEKGEAQGATRAHIMDFKSDAQLSRAAGMAHYRPQMRAYRRLIALAFSLSLEHVQVTLLHCPARGEAEAWDYDEADWR